MYVNIQCYIKGNRQVFLNLKEAIILNHLIMECVKLGTKIEMEVIIEQAILPHSFSIFLLLPFCLQFSKY
ncbi:hypothetical protein CHH53_05815 [Terribacillus sp. 7520-G]|nr:hypothetical protein CHH53_05815 [Terribacillus sp. 7520-G]